MWEAVFFMRPFCFVSRVHVIILRLTLLQVLRCLVPVKVPDAWQAFGRLWEFREQIGPLQQHDLFEALVSRQRQHLFQDIFHIHKRMSYCWIKKKFQVRNSFLTAIPHSFYFEDFAAMRCLIKSRKNCLQKSKYLSIIREKGEVEKIWGQRVIINVKLVHNFARFVFLRTWLGSRTLDQAVKPVTNTNCKESRLLVIH